MRLGIKFVIFFVSLLGSLWASAFEYYFQSFEFKSGWTAGSIQDSETEFKLLQGDAVIAQLPEADSSQILELKQSDPFSAIFLDASEFAAYEEVYFEALVRPVATDESKGEEFMDFGGAILGFFRDGQTGGIQALSSKNEKESFWISTGLRFELNENLQLQDWIQVRIRLNRTYGRWSLALNDQWVLNDLKLLELPQEVALPLFLYGHTEGSNLFDDLLLSNIPPQELEKESVRRAAVNARFAKSSEENVGGKIVTNKKINATARHLVENEKVSTSKTPKLKIGKVKFTLDTGSRIYEGKIGTLEKGAFPITAYSPGYDEKGNMKTAILNIAADIYLEPGVDLAKLEWELVPLLDWPDTFGEPLATGNFGTGLVQKIAVKPAWQKIAVAIFVKAKSSGAQ